jgi:cephalosporin hydroxylase
MTLTDYLRLQYALLQRLISGRTHVNPAEQNLVNDFHRLYYNSADKGGTWNDTHWLGNKILKCPLDVWIYQEILFQTKPDLVIETGTFNGGSALFMAHLMDVFQKGQILTIDINGDASRPVHPRIQYLLGSSTADSIVEKAKSLARGKTVMVILDSDHSAKHVKNELEIYSHLVTKGNYLIVEDSNVNGHPVGLDHGPGPMEAIDSYLVGNPNFELDLTREKFFLTFNPKGYWKRTT